MTRNGWDVQDCVSHDESDFELQSRERKGIREWRIVQTSVYGEHKRLNIWKTTNGTLAQAMFRGVHYSHERRLAELQAELEKEL